MSLNKICEKLREKRLEKGFDFRTKELRLTLDENGLIKSTRYENDTPSHKLVEDCMLLANKAAATRIKHGIFRNHGTADLKKINALLEDLAVLGIDAVYESDNAKMIKKIQAQADKIGIREMVDKLIIKAQKRAEYGEFSLGHFALGFKNYTHFTSPIRRYSDLLLHRFLKANAKKDTKFYSYLLLNISEICENLNILEREADKVEFDFNDRKFARFAKENLGKIFRCYIDENTTQTIVRLDDKLKGARIFIDNFTCDILTPVLVRLESSDIGTAKITGKVVKKQDV